MKGYVYLLEDVDRNVYKIGVTRNINGKRFKTLQTGNSSKLNLLSFFCSDYPFRLENMLHKHYSSQNVRSEWFELSENDINGFETLCETKNNIIKALENNPFFNKNLH